MLVRAGDRFRDFTGFDGRRRAASDAAIRWDLIRFSGTVVGSSVGSCSTSLPSKAVFRIDWRSLALRDRLSDTVSRTFDINDMSRCMEATTACISSSGGRGHGRVTELGDQVFSFRAGRLVGDLLAELVALSELLADDLHNVVGVGIVFRED